MYENQHQQQGSSLANSARSKFVRKVYTLMTLQLATTVAVVYANMILPYFAYLQATSSWLFFMASVGSIVTLAMLCI